MKSKAVASRSSAIDGPAQPRPKPRSGTGVSAFGWAPSRPGRAAASTEVSTAPVTIIIAFAGRKARSAYERTVSSVTVARAALEPNVGIFAGPAANSEA